MSEKSTTDIPSNVPESDDGTKHIERIAEAVSTKTLEKWKRAHDEAKAEEAARQPAKKETWF